MPKRCAQSKPCKRRIIDQRKSLLISPSQITGSVVLGQKAKVAAGTKTREFRFPNLFDLHSAMLYLRSQSLSDRSTHRVVVYPATSAYLATITVLGREKISG